MSCSSCTQTVSQELQRKLMFGPLYDRYKDANLFIDGPPRTYSQHESLIPVYTNECCAYVSSDFKANSNWKMYAAILGLWFAYTAALLGMLTTIRHDPLVKIRDLRVVVTSTISGAILFYSLMSVEMLEGTGPKYETTMYIAIFVPLYVFLPIIRSLQALFIYKWHEAKAEGHTNLNWFTRVKFVLGIRFYFSASVAMLLVVCLPIICMVLKSPVFTHPGDSGISTRRCWWWHIPDEYTRASTNSSFCGCINAVFLKETDVTTLCEEGFVTTCLGSSPLLDIESELCTACESIITSSSKTSKCETAFLNFYTSGSCGWPSRTPFFNYCLAGMFADSTLNHVMFGVAFGFIGLNMMITWPLIFKKDFFGIILENIVILIANTIVMTSLLLEFEQKELLNWWTLDTSLMVLVCTICFWVTSTTTLGFPFALYHWRRRHRISNLDKLNVNDVSSLLHTESAQETSQAGSALIFNTTAPNAITLQRCIASESQKRVYLKFCVEEFTTENIRFLDECMKLLRSFEASCNTQDLTVAAQNIYDQFIAAGSDMEINISSTLKNTLATRLAAVRNEDSNSEYVMRLQRPKLLLTPEGLLLGSLREAFIEITQIMAITSWPGFKRSRHYTEFLAVIANDRQRLSVDLQLHAWLGSSDKQTKATSSHPLLHAELTPMGTGTPTTNHDPDGASDAADAMERHSALVDLVANPQLPPRLSWAGP